MNYPITVCIIAKNEEKNIGECLKRLKPYGMEIVVVDTGSSDKTKKIAMEYADKVIDYKWENDFSKARNFCAMQASNEWILAIDCDEYIMDVNMEQLLLYTQKYEFQYGNVNVNHIARNEGEKLAYITTNEDRLYDRRYYEYVGAVNEKLQMMNIGFNPNEDDESFSIPMQIFHVGYDVSSAQIRLKQERKLRTLHGALNNTTNKREKAYIRFLMGQAYGAIKHYQKAIENYHLAMETGSDLDEDILQICVVELAAAYKRIGREEDAVLLIQENTELVTNDNFTSEHGFAILRNGVTIEDLPEVIFEIASHNVDDYDGFILVSYKLIIELYNMFGLDELANPYIEKYTQLRRENMLASGF